MPGNVVAVRFERSQDLIDEALLACIGLLRSILSYLASLSITISHKVVFKKNVLYFLT